MKKYFLGIILISLQINAYFLSGYLPQKPSQKVYLQIDKNIIIQILENKTLDINDSNLIETESFIFPGLMDLHNHTQFNSLPLWDKAKGQYDNRFEWRETSNYLTSIKPYMWLLKNNKEVGCASLKWAELKALFGGVTSIQGATGEKSCVTQFGPRNIDIASELPNNKKLRANFEFFNPEFIKNSYLPFFERYTSQQMLTPKDNYLQFLNNEKINDWILSFQSSEKNIQKALELLLPHNCLKSLQVVKINFTTAQEIIDIIPTFPECESVSLKHPKIQALLEKFLTDYMSNDSSQKALSSLLSLSNFQDEKSQYTNFYLVNLFNPRLLDIINFFEAIQKSMESDLRENKILGFVTHLSEGRHDEPFTKNEFKYAKNLNLLHPGLSLIHGVGMNFDDFNYARKNNINIIWSPFSNLLLYNDTLDLAKALISNVNIALGSDWSVTGSKSLIDEMKVAKRFAYEKKISLSDEEIVKMATQNSAKALQLQDSFGKVQAGFVADLVLVHKKSNKAPYTQFIYSGNKDISLTIVNGEPLFGDKNLIEKTNLILGGTGEDIIFENKKCNKLKSLRIKDNYYNLKNYLISEFEKVKVTQTLSDVKLSQTFDLDKAFDCEDEKYVTRLKTFVKFEVKENEKQRASRRHELGLPEKLNSLE